MDNPASFRTFGRAGMSSAASGSSGVLHRAFAGVLAIEVFGGLICYIGENPLVDPMPSSWNIGIFVFEVISGALCSMVFYASKITLSTSKAMYFFIPLISGFSFTLNAEAVIEIYALSGFRHKESKYSRR